ncbi:MAG: hypothetical protein NXY57DRAFT_1044679 [Lentinula lateritia]|nr:MAG: hypothetical protein NXY57DRAFT_1044679 [Lentinula lateritia]
MDDEKPAVSPFGSLSSAKPVFSSNLSSASTHSTYGATSQPGFGFALKASTSSSSPTATITSWASLTTPFSAFSGTSLPFAAVGYATKSFAKQQDGEEKVPDSDDELGGHIEEHDHHGDDDDEGDFLSESYDSHLGEDEEQSEKVEGKKFSDEPSSSSSPEPTGRNNPELNQTLFHLPRGEANEDLRCGGDDEPCHASKAKSTSRPSSSYPRLPLPPLPIIFVAIVGGGGTFLGIFMFISSLAITSTIGVKMRNPGLQVELCWVLSLRRPDRRDGAQALLLPTGGTSNKSGELDSDSLLKSEAVAELHLNLPKRERMNIAMNLLQALVRLRAWGAQACRGSLPI